MTNFSYAGWPNVNTTQDVLAGIETQAQHAFPADSSGNAARNAAWYLAHTEKGESIRSLARATGTAPATISRAVRKIEHARDDPLFDRILSDFEHKSAIPAGIANENTTPQPQPTGGPINPTELRKEA